jgi:hypothetical protein
MTATTIKVDSSVRDRLAALAHERGTTMGALLAEIAERLERDSFFARAHQQLRDLRDHDPNAWGVYRAEAESWQRGTDRDVLDGGDDDGWWE